MRLIDADAFDERVRAAGGMSEEELSEDFKDGVLAVLYMMSKQPTITAQPEKRTEERAETHACDSISRQAAIDRINKQREHLQPDIYPQDKIGDAAYRICAEFIGRLPSAQPERKKGRWRRRLVDSGFNADWHCSECGWKTSLEEHGYNFCPNCGANMRGGQDDE